MTEPTNEAVPDPDVYAALDTALYLHQHRHERRYSDGETAEEARIDEGVAFIAAHAFDVIATGAIPDDLASRLSDYRPDATPEQTLTDLLAYNAVHHHVEFEIAKRAVGRLQNASKRIELSAALLFFLFRASPHPRAIKYFRKATELYLAGYDVEVVIMCAAVLESAMAERFDEQMRARGEARAFKHTDDYSAGQRMKFEEKHNLCFSKQQRLNLKKVVNWRNDAVHMHPDMMAPPLDALFYTAELLRTLFPR